ncbi:MAG: site-2 protease family protein [Roseburia sp.]|nr:site-2 protease family protein [Roseburia sp.]
MEYFSFIILSIVILLVMVLIHELGHYTAAKILGFTVEEFSVGFGPKIFGKRRKNGELFSLRMLPLGGYCAFLGETDDGDAKSDKTDVKAAVDTSDNISADGAEQAKADAATVEKEADGDLLFYVMRSKIDECAETERATEAQAVRTNADGKPLKTFYEQKPWKRIIVLLGGVVFNFISAIIFSLIYIWSVGYAAPQITSVYSDPSGQLYCPNLRVGDIVLAVDGQKITVMKAFSDLASRVDEGETVTFTVDRDGEVTEVPVTRRTVSVTDESGEISTYVGFGFVSQTVTVGATAANAFKYCVPYTFKLSWAILGSFGQLITGKIPITSVTGPIGSVNTMAQLSAANWRNILILLPLLASNLAIFNLLPFPALDGAQIVFTAVEWIRKKPINRKIQNTINFVGMIVLLLFVLIVDILSFAL